MLMRVVCSLLGHKWARVSYPEGDTADAFFLRCRRCGHENDSARAPTGPVIGGF